MSTPTALDQSDAVPNRFLDQGSGTDRRAHRCHTPATHHPSRARSLALHLGPAPGSQRSPHDRSPAHSHHSWSSCDLCSRLWLWPAHGRRKGHKRRLILPRPQCSLTWRVFFIDVCLCIAPFPSFLNQRMQSLLVACYLLVAHHVGMSQQFANIIGSHAHRLEIIGRRSAGPARYIARPPRRFSKVSRSAWTAG